MTCKVCKDSITQNPCETWANVPDDEIEFAAEDNKKMEKEWMETWMDEVEVFQEEHYNCDPTGFNF